VRGVRGGGLLHVMGRLGVMPLRVVGVLGGGRVVSALVVLGSLGVVLRCLGVMLCCLGVMLCCWVIGHDGPSRSRPRPEPVRAPGGKPRSGALSRCIPS